MNIRVHAYTHTYVYECTYTRTHTHTHTLVRILTHAFIYTHTIQYIKTWRLLEHELQLNTHTDMHLAQLHSAPDVANHDYTLSHQLNTHTHTHTSLPPAQLRCTPHV